MRIQMSSTERGGTAFVVYFRSAAGGRHRFQRDRLLSGRSSEQTLNTGKLIVSTLTADCDLLSASGAAFVQRKLAITLLIGYRNAKLGPHALWPNA